MSANRIFLVCQHCPKLEHSLLLADRADGNAQYIAGNLKRADDWFAKHQRCGTGVDNFKLAYHRPQNWDVSPPAQNTVAGGVKLGLINGGKHE
jgi:hypothetical protein